MSSWHWSWPPEGVETSPISENPAAASRHWLAETRPEPETVKVTVTSVDEPTAVVAAVPPAGTQEAPVQAKLVRDGAARMTSKPAPLEMTRSGFTTRISAAPGEAEVRSSEAERWPESVTVAATAWAPAPSTTTWAPVWKRCPVTLTVWEAPAAAEVGFTAET